MTTLVVLLSLAVYGCGDDSSTDPPAARFSEVEDFGFSLVSEFILGTFAGDITIGPVAAPGIHVVATKWAASEEDLDLIEVLAGEGNDKAEVAAIDTTGLESAFVNFAVSMPAGRTLEIYTGSGKIEYSGIFAGNADFRADGGLIVFRIPSGTEVRLDLDVGVGGILIDFPVTGEVILNQRVIGQIGTGRDGRIRASVGWGDIQILQQ
jgi:hypothetical protein